MSIDNTEVRPNLEGKDVFLDMDGTLVEYRSFDRVNCSLKECFLRGMYKDCRPLTSIIEYVKNSGYKEVYILSQIQSYIGIQEKIEWLHEYAPFIKDANMFFISENKALALDTYVEMLGLCKDNIIFVDDTVSTLEATEDMGYKSYHVSSLVS